MWCKSGINKLKYFVVIVKIHIGDVIKHDTGIVLYSCKFDICELFALDKDGFGLFNCFVKICYVVIVV